MPYFLKIESCKTCGHAANQTQIGLNEVAQITKKRGMASFHESTKTRGLVFGGGACSAPRSHLSEWEGCIYCGSDQCVSYTHGESVCG